MSYTYNIESPNLKENTKLFENKNWKSCIDDSIKDRLISDINEWYFKQGIGLKLISRNVLGCSYSVTRSVFKFLDIEFRKGYNVSTEFSRKFRKDKAINERNNKIGLFDPSIERKAVTDTRGCQGYYYNTSRNKFVWLRSSWEYTYAKFLNKIGEEWDIECTTFKLSDGTNYCPDFFIFKDNKLIKIVEIKGYWDNRAYKLDLLRKEYFKNQNIQFIMVRDIKIYAETKKELEEWKQIRKSKDFVLSQ